MSNEEQKGKLFVGGLSWDTTQASLLAYFSRFGEVMDCVVVMNPTTGKSRGFGFVNFKDPSCVETVLAASPHILDGKQIDPNGCNRKKLNKTTGGKENSRKKLFVGGLPPNIDEQQLRDGFSKYGKVNDVVIVFDQQKQKPRGFGFLTFEDEDSVERVVQERFVQIAGKQVECKRAEPKEHNAPTSASNQHLVNGTAAGAPMVLAQTADGSMALVPASALTASPAAAIYQQYQQAQAASFLAGASPDLAAYRAAAAGLQSDMMQQQFIMPSGVRFMQSPAGNGMLQGSPYIMMGSHSVAGGGTLAGLPGNYVMMNGAAPGGANFLMSGAGQSVARSVGMLMPSAGGAGGYILAGNPGMQTQYVMSYSPSVPQLSASESPYSIQMPSAQTYYTTSKAEGAAGLMPPTSEAAAAGLDLATAQLNSQYAAAYGVGAMYAAAGAAGGTYSAADSNSYLSATALPSVVGRMAPAGTASVHGYHPYRR